MTSDIATARIGTFMAEPRCTCAAIRRAARRVTQLYDEALKPLGLKLTQYSLLLNISVLDGPSITDLAEHVAMDRTTLTRNLAPLRHAGWVQLTAGADKRRRCVMLSKAGRAILEAARPLWHAAEMDLRDAAGEERMAMVRQLLNETVDAIGVPKPTAP